MLSVTPVYLAAAVALYSCMTFAIIAQRRKRQISLGDGRQKDFARIIRGHANFAEYAPLTLLAITMAELGGVPAVVLHASGVMLILGRILHGYWFFYRPEGLKCRVAGMVLTLFALWTASTAAVLVALAS
ncbi:MAG: MAPEG family protein [Rhodospirillales bacterium]